MCIFIFPTRQVPVWKCSRHSGQACDDFKVTHQNSLVVQKDDYYPFGLSFNSYQRPSSTEQKYLFNGKERDETMGWDDFGARMYQPDLGKFFTQDRFAEKYFDYNPYHYVMNNPINAIDINGDSTFVVANDNGTYTVTGGNLDNPDDRGVYVMGEDGAYTSIGNSITSNSFFDNDGNAVVGSVIDPGSTEGQDFIDNEIIEANPSLTEYMANAKGGEPLDFKSRGISEKGDGVTPDQHRYRGSVTKDGEFGSARDFGNMGAGIVAGRNGLSWGQARLGFDALESYQQGKFATEGPTTQKAQRVGFNIGVSLRPKGSQRMRTRQRELKNR